MAAVIEPLRVSPFIKFCRWSLLLTGILYGSSRYQSLLKKQTIIRDAYEKTRPEREARANLEKRLRLEEEMKILSEAVGSNIA